MKRTIIILITAFFFVTAAKAQEKKDTANFMMGFVKDGDTIIHQNIKEVIVFPEKHFRNKRVERRYWRYAAKVKKVYPLAQEAKELLVKYEPLYYSMEDKRDRRKLMKQLEKQLMEKHSEELKKWSISDGRILLKLINRETERTPYSLIQAFRGDFSAFFWQGIAKIFKNDLKEGYEPQGDDQWLEEIVTLIELGYI